jgi:hypothetical protein
MAGSSRPYIERSWASSSITLSATIEAELMTILLSTDESYLRSAGSDKAQSSSFLTITKVPLLFFSVTDSMSVEIKSVSLSYCLVSEVPGWLALMFLTRTYAPARSATMTTRMIAFL